MQPPPISAIKQLQQLASQHSQRLIADTVSNVAHHIACADRSTLHTIITALTDHINHDLEALFNGLPLNLDGKLLRPFRHYSHDPSRLLVIIKQLRNRYLELVDAHQGIFLPQIDLPLMVQQQFDAIEIELCSRWNELSPTICLSDSSQAYIQHDYPLFYNSHSVMLLIDPASGEIVEANPAACSYYGYNHQQLTNRNIATINTLASSELSTELQRAHSRQQRCFHFRHRLANDEIRDVEVYTGPLQLHGRALLYSIIYDVSERTAIEDHLRKITAAVDHSPTSIVITDRQGRIEYVNQCFCDITGYQPDDVIGRNPRILRGQQPATDDVQQLWQTILAGKVWRGLFHNRKKNGELFWEQASIAPVTNNDGAITHFVAIKEDITQKKALEEKIWHQAHYDALTDLPNRVLFYQRLNDVIQHRKRQESGAALLFIDLDRFKQVNDSLGHDCGDQLLQQVAKRLCSTVRETDTVARVGGDEFTVILHHTKGRSAIEVTAHKILAKLHQPFHLNGQQVTISGSIGVAIINCDHQPDSLLKQADRAMFSAKQQGRNTVVVFDS